MPPRTQKRAPSLADRLLASDKYKRLVSPANQASKTNFEQKKEEPAKPEEEIKPEQKADPQVNE
jgi:hypothetical protein